MRLPICAITQNCVFNAIVISHTIELQLLKGKNKAFIETAMYGKKAVAQGLT